MIEEEAVMAETVPQPQPAPADFPVPLAVFAAALRPRRIPLVRNGNPVVFKGRTVMTATRGHPDEVWLKLLKINHGRERRTPEAWSALIDTYREQPAHPADPRMTR